MTTQPVDPGFWADVRAAASVWRGSPAVPALYGVVTAVYVLLAATRLDTSRTCGADGRSLCPSDPSVVALFTLLSVLSLPVLVFHVGLCGAARVWYARRFAGLPFTAGDAWTVSWRMLGRMILLGLLFAAVTSPLWLTSVVLHLQGHETAGLAVSAASFVVGDLLFTFATPGVALYNGNPWVSFVSGLRLLRSAWPECAAYALVPPLALTALSSAGGEATPRWLEVLGAGLGPGLTLLFAGAATRFVLRRQQPWSEWGTVRPPSRAPRWEPAGPPPRL